MTAANTPFAASLAQKFSELRLEKDECKLVDGKYQLSSQTCIEIACHIASLTSSPGEDVDIEKTARSIAFWHGQKIVGRSPDGQMMTVANRAGRPTGWHWETDKYVDSHWKEYIACAEFMRDEIGRLTSSTHAGWRTMDSAPKDGTLVDLWYPRGIGREANCFWHKALSIWGRDVWTGAHHPQETNFISRNVDPTHWLPLPAPPVEKGEEDV